MKNLLMAESYFIKKDTMFKAICFLLIIGSSVLLFWMGYKGGFEIVNVAQPLTMLIPLSLFLYFIIPIYVCFFATEGFEYGSIKVILASGQSRVNYLTGKYLSIIKIIVLWLLLFFIPSYILFMLYALIMKTPIGNSNIYEDVLRVLRVLGLNVLYLSTYASIIVMLALFLKRTASAVVATFLVVFGDFITSGYFREASTAWVRTISNHTLTTQIMKFSGIYVINSHQIILAGTKNYIVVLIIPVTILSICLTVTYLFFGKRDIHA